MTDVDPYLSIVLVGRNDGFGGDFNERFFRALRFNHERLCDAGVSHEFIFVEWAPIGGQTRLAELLRDELPELEDSLTAFIVDPRYQEAFSLNPKLRFMEFVAKNVGARRAKGAFVLSTNTDIYFSRGVINVMADQALEHQTLYRATRIDLKLGADLSHVEWSLLEDPRNHTGFIQIKPPWFTGGAGDFQLLDRASWFDLRGFNEVYRVAKISIDANFCVKAFASGYKVTDIGAPVYHLNHVGSYRITRGLYRESPSDAPWGRNWNVRVIYDNPESWGLAQAPLQVLDHGMNYLCYEPQTAPPLVDLRRVLVATTTKD